MISHGKPGLPPAKEHPYCAATASDATVELRSDAVQATALLKAAPRGIIPDATQLRVTLYAGRPYLDLEWSITDKTPDPWPEGGWLCFPLRADNPTFHLARLGSIVNPAKDLVPGSNHEIFCLNGGLLVTGADGTRTGLCPIDAQLVSLEHPGLWRYSRDFVAHQPDVFVNLFNNVYSTNFASGSKARGRRACVCGWWRRPSRREEPRWWAVHGRPAPAAWQPCRTPRRASCPRSLSVWPSRNGQIAQAARRRSSRFGAACCHGLRFQPLWARYVATAVGPGRQADRHGPFARWDEARMAQPCDLRGQPPGPPLTVSEHGTFDANQAYGSPDQVRTGRRVRSRRTTNRRIRQKESYYAEGTVLAVDHTLGARPVPRSPVNTGRSAKYGGTARDRATGGTTGGHTTDRFQQ